jgi:Cu/Ag efflux pump CusA
MLSIALREDALAEFGFQPVAVLQAVQTAYQGQLVAQVRRENRVEDVVVVLAEDRRHDPAAVGALLVRSDSGTVLPLNELADIRLESGRLSILHDGGRRRQGVTAVPRGRDVVSFVADAERALRERLVMPPGSYIEFGGTAEAQAGAQRELLYECGLALFGVLIVLWTAFQSARMLLLVLANIPFGLVGGVAAVVLIKRVSPEAGGLTLGSLVGFVTLLGITMRNSIMLISHCRHLVDVEGAEWNEETAVRAATDRVVPITMTALVTGLALVPLALGSGSAGREIEGPMAIVILGGLMSSTSLNLLVLPSLALRFGRFGEGEASRIEASTRRP